MEIQHGGPVVDVPEGWADQSTLLFVAPPQSHAAPTVSKVAAPTEAIAIRFRVSNQQDAAALLGEEAAGLRSTDPELALVEEGPFRSGLGVGAFVIHRLQVAQTPLLQMSTATVLGPICILATASAAEARFPRVRAELERALSSMRFA